MSFPAAIASAFRNYANGHGRATRSEYWWFELFNAIVVIIVLVPTRAVGTPAARIAGFAIAGLFVLATLAPHIAVAVRRLHDTNRSGWYIFIALVPLIGWLLLLIPLLLPSKASGAPERTDKVRAYIS
jgi:uncharacterized membrane protein YhaH (DUF805 family)